MFVPFFLSSLSLLPSLFPSLFPSLPSPTFPSPSLPSLFPSLFPSLPSPNFLSPSEGLQLKLNGQDLPFASLTYALSPLTNKLVPVDWQLIVTEDVRSQHIRCHELQDGDNLRELIAGFRKAYTVAVVLINTSDNYILQPSFLSGAQRSYFPVLVLTKSDGKELLKKVEQCKENVLARISVESYTGTLQTWQVAGDEPIHTYSDQTALRGQ